MSILSMPSALDHSLSPFLGDLARFRNTRQLESSELHARLRPEIERVLGGVHQENLARPRRNGLPDCVRVLAWNIERGIRLEGIIEVLREHPRIRSSDILLLTELDYGMARTANRFVAREIAAAVGLNYVFAPCYLALNKGSGIEAHTAGENTHSLHGNALFSPFPLHRAHSLALPNGKDKMQGVEKRLGCQRAVIADVEHARGLIRAVSLHLDAHSSQSHRHGQMCLLLDHLEGLRPALPVIIGGDWNTTTHNSRRALFSILGYFRRVLMGVRHVVENHYPYPERWFERRLFRELERRGYRYRDLNLPGVCTLHYDVSGVALNRNLADWIPRWCFWFIHRALQGAAGRCGMKLDWFAGKEIRIDPRDPKQCRAVVQGLKDSEGRPLSDHDPILLSFVHDR